MHTTEYGESDRYMRMYLQMSNAPGASTIDPLRCLAVDLINNLDMREMRRALKAQRRDLKRRARAHPAGASRVEAFARQRGMADIVVLAWDAEAEREGTWTYEGRARHEPPAPAMALAFQRAAMVELARASAPFMEVK
jgi:hypothetical protein